MPRGQYSTRQKPPRLKTEKRIQIPQPPERPLHFQARGLIKKEFLRKDPWWFTFHRRGPRRLKIGGNLLEARAISHGLVRGTLPERIVYRALMELLHFAPGDFDFQSCVSPHHKVLTADFRWVEAGSLQPGDELLSFEEYGSPNRAWTKGTVTKNYVESMPAYEVGLSNGDIIITTGEHPWLVHFSKKKRDYGKNTGYDWVSTEELKPGMWVPRFFDLWETDSSYESGWLAGFFDGEGSVIQGKDKHYLSLTIGQNAGSMFDTFLRYVDELGFKFSVYDYRDKYKRSYDEGKRQVIQCRISGGRSEALKFLGTIRPAKLDRVDLERLGKLTKIEQVQVEYVIPVGYKPIARLEVDKHTYIVEGYGMHNSLQGGRIELGGIVADFIFPALRLVINVQGPTHGEYLRVQKDREQRLALEEMGYDVYDLWEDTIYDEYKLEDWLRKTFNWNHSGGGFQGESLGDYMGQFHTSGDVIDDAQWEPLYHLALDTLADLYSLEGEVDVTL